VTDETIEELAVELLETLTFTGWDLAHEHTRESYRHLARTLTRKGWTKA